MTAPKSTAARKPPAPRKPQDRKPKAADVEEYDALTEPREITVDGITFTARLNITTDFEFMEGVADIDNGEYQHLPAVLRRLVGDPEAYRRVKEHLRDENGRIDMEPASEFFGKAMDALSAYVAAENAKGAAEAE